MSKKNNKPTPIALPENATGEVAEEVTEVTEVTTVASNENVKYTKEQLLNSKKFANDKDIIATIIGDDEKTTLAEIQNKLEDFKRKVVS